MIDNRHVSRIGKYDNMVSVFEKRWTGLGSHVKVSKKVRWNGNGAKKGFFEHKTSVWKFAVQI